LGLVDAVDDLADRGQCLDDTPRVALDGGDEVADVLDGAGGALRRGP
jgi:hypothetical protein